MSRRKRRSQARSPSKRLDAPAPVSRNIDQVALEARQRVHGLSEHQSRSEHAESVLGRLWLSGKLRMSDTDDGTRLRDAGYHYLAICRRYDEVLIAPRMRGGGDFNRLGGVDHGDASKEYVDRVTAAKAAWDRCQDALKKAAGERQFVIWAVNAVVLNDKEFPGFLDALCEGLSALADELRLPEGKAA